MSVNPYHQPRPLTSVQFASVIVSVLGWPKLLIRRFAEEGNTEDNALAMEFLEDRVRNFEGVGSRSVVARRFFCHWAGACGS